MALTEWYFAVHDAGTGQYKTNLTTGSGWMYVCTAGSVAPPTIYTNERGSVALTSTNAGAGVLVNTLALVYITNGWCRFWTETSVTSLDISFLMATGECGIYRGATPSTHMLYVNTNYAGPMKLWVPFAFEATGGSAIDTKLDLPADLEILDAGCLVTTADAAETVDFGFINSGESGDEDGLLDGMLLTNTGFVSPNLIITNGSSADYYTDTNGKYGALLATTLVGSDSAVTTIGGQTRLSYLTNGTIKSLIYNISSSDTAYGFLTLTYTKAMG